MSTPCLIIFRGLAGTGKTTIAKKLAETMHAVYLRIDTIESAIKNPELPEAGYLTAYSIAHENLALGNTVIADSVNAITESRLAWQKTATDLNIPYIDIEIICSDLAEHKSRVENRNPSTNQTKVPTWEEVIARDYEQSQDKNIITIDTAKTSPEAAVKILIDKISNY